MYTGRSQKLSFFTLLSQMQANLQGYSGKAIGHTITGVENEKHAQLVHNTREIVVCVSCLFSCFYCTENDSTCEQLLDLLDLRHFYTVRGVDVIAHKFEIVVFYKS